ncbi:YhgE/Pip domain-containing protein, partial [Enterococcus faecium]|nr:YhgE/Pip domain-containing protein [Enterococcus faecium]
LIDSIQVGTELTDEQKQAIQTIIDGIPQQQATIDKLIQFLTELQNNAGNDKLQGIIDKLTQGKTLLDVLKKALNTAVQAGSISQDLFNEIKQAVSNVNSLINGIDVNNVSST